MRAFVILHDIRSAHNVGSIFRTADGAGVTKLYLCGYTPAPTDRFGRVVEDIEKTSLGATHSVPWEHGERTSECIERLRNEGIRIVVVEQHERALPYTDVSYKEDTAFIFGNEIDGVSEDILKMADDIIHIPMHGMKESLNVSVSAGVVLFDAIRKNR